MGQFGGYYKGEKKKSKKTALEKKAQNSSGKESFNLPKVEIISQKKK